MAARTFAQINCSLLKSRKMRGLTHAERWAYVCVHLTPLSSFTGVFNYPFVMWRADANLTEDELESAIARLEAAGLIEWDANEELVRIVGFHRQRPPENASRSMSLAVDFSDMMLCEDSSLGIVLRAAAEFAVAAIERSRNWKPDSGEIPKLRQTIGSFLRAAYQEHDEALLEALAGEVEAASKSARAEVSSLLQPFAMDLSDTVSAPCRDRVGIRDVDDTRRKPDGYDYEDKNETAYFLIACVSTKPLLLL